MIYEPINPHSLYNKWTPAIWGGITAAVILIAAGIMVRVRAQLRKVVPSIIAVGLLATAAALLFVRDSVLKRPADFGTAVLTTSNREQNCSFPADAGKFEVVVLDPEAQRWHAGDTVPFDDSDNIPTLDISLYRTSYWVEWGGDSLGGDSITSPNSLIFSDDASSAAAKIGVPDLCAYADLLMPSGDVTWAETTRKGIDGQTIYIASSVCQQAIPVLKTQILAANPGDCDLELSLAEARLTFDPDYDVYR